MTAIRMSHPLQPRHFRLPKASTLEGRGVISESGHAQPRRLEPHDRACLLRPQKQTRLQSIGVRRFVAS
jgi:hypothetical protein